MKRRGPASEDSDLQGSDMTNQSIHLPVIQWTHHMPGHFFAYFAALSKLCCVHEYPSMLLLIRVQCAYF